MVVHGCGCQCCCSCDCVLHVPSVGIGQQTATIAVGVDSVGMCAVVCVVVGGEFVVVGVV